MTTIGLIRDGISEWNCLGKAQGLSDIPLNEEGIKQALKVELDFQKKKIGI